ncbi:hypothetical protein [Pseudobacteriovorax antillogorgiicola]|uniref:Uncharacterized protein n=1 Tax=Pseudobacteriovorax antillogorgiicola TaxID=1513793 RepID=A0A1Y6C8J6_9BACT|nr:hypothetical protein [Pseudobacteriovorax antillogorgiicola]TCS50666.1 hypothetical protein EDD56_11248 [Pseudobacteriovorax antillogorgiicola]SMF39944.1 hypothetical protein SAMN06296036_11247 [Pseudobacteriovorax antillogorgiicola]
MKVLFGIGLGLGLWASGAAASSQTPTLGQSCPGFRAVENMGAVYFTEDCETVFAGPPELGVAELTGFFPHIGKMSQCSRLDRHDTLIDSLNQRLTDLILEGDFDSEKIATIERQIERLSILGEEPAVDLGFILKYDWNKLLDRIADENPGFRVQSASISDGQLSVSSQALSRVAATSLQEHKIPFNGSASVHLQLNLRELCSSFDDQGNLRDGLSEKDYFAKIAPNVVLTTKVFTPLGWTASFKKKEFIQRMEFDLEAEVAFWKGKHEDLLINSHKSEHFSFEVLGHNPDSSIIIGGDNPKTYVDIMLEVKANFMSRMADEFDCSKNLDAFPQKKLICQDIAINKDLEPDNPSDDEDRREALESLKEAVSDRFCGDDDVSSCQKGELVSSVLGLIDFVSVSQKITFDVSGELTESIELGQYINRESTMTFQLK